MKCQNTFSEKKKKNIYIKKNTSKCHLLKVLPSMLSVKKCICLVYNMTDATWCNMDSKLCNMVSLHCVFAWFISLVMQHDIKSVVQHDIAGTQFYVICCHGKHDFPTPSTTYNRVNTVLMNQVPL